MKGKEKCRILKEIRAEIARANEIAWVTENCTHKGDCRGTCPKCEAEVRALERALERRRAMGKTVAVVGLSAGIIATTASCEAFNEFSGNEVAGDMVIEETAAESSDTAVVLDGDMVAPLPGEEVELGGAPLQVYYLTDFTMFDSERTYQVTQGFNLYDVVEGEEGPSGLTVSAQEGDTLVLLGHNGTETVKAYLFLVRYKDVLYAVDEYDWEHFAVEMTANGEDPA